MLSGVLKSGSPTVKLTTSFMPTARLNIFRIGEFVTVCVALESAFMGASLLLIMIHRTAHYIGNQIYNSLFRSIVKNEGFVKGNRRKP